MGNIILGLIMMAGGFVLIAKTEWFLNNFGRIAFFENHLGLQGGTRLGYKLIGLAFVFLGLLTTVGLIGGFIAWVASPLTKYQNY